jgi:arylsulfatase A-like enzyme
VGASHPYFAVLNFMDAHGPYDPPASFRERFNGGRTQLDRYDGGIAYIDSIVGVLVRDLAARGEVDHTIIAVTSDHGELFGEHGMTEHASTPYLPVVHVPLILRYPPLLVASTRRAEPVSLRDLAATLLDLAAAAEPVRLPGRSLRHPTEGQRPIFMRVARGVNMPPSHPTADGDVHAVLDSAWHYLRFPSGREELYAWRRDPQELVNLANSPAAREVLLRFRAALADFLSRAE